MADVAATKILARRNDVVAYEWVDLTENDTAVAVPVPFRPDKTILVSGDFGSSGDIRVEGAIDDAAAVWAELHDVQGNVISFTSADIETILENVVFIRPKVAAGTSVSVTVRILMS